MTAETRKNKLPTGDIVLGGVLSACVLVLALISQLTGFSDILTYTAVTPIVIAILKKDFKFGIIVSFVSTILISASLGLFPSGIYFFIMIIPPALTLGYLMKKKEKITGIILILSIILFITTTLSIIMTSFITGISLTDDVNSAVKSIYLFSKNTLEAFPEIVYAIFSLIPSAIIIGLMIKYKKLSSSSVIPVSIAIAIISALLVNLISKYIGIAPEEIFNKMGQEGFKSLFLSSIPFIIGVISISYSFYLWFFNEWISARLKITEKKPLGNGIIELIEYPKYFAYIFIISLSIFIITSITKISLTITIFNNTKINLLSGLMLNIFLFLGFLLFIKGMFILRDFVFTKIKSFPMRLLTVLMLMTILAPFPIAIGWYVCFKGAKIIIETAHAINPEVSNDNVKFKIVEYEKTEEKSKEESINQPQKEDVKKEKSKKKLKNITRTVNNSEKKSKKSKKR